MKKTIETTEEDKNLIPADIATETELLGKQVEQFNYNQNKYIAKPEQIAAWKKEYGEGNILRIDVAVSKTDIATGYFVLPHAKGNDKSLGIYSRAIQKLQDKDTVGAGVFLISNCFLSGDPRIQGTDSRVHVSAAAEIVSKIDFFSASSTTI